MAWYACLSTSEEGQDKAGRHFGGAIAGESGMPGRLVGTIDMYDKYTFVEGAGWV